MNISVDTARKQKELLDQQVFQAQLQNAMSNIDLGIASKYKEVMFKQNLANMLAQEFATYQNVAQGWKHVNIEKQNANTNAYNAKTNRMNAQTNAAVGDAQIQNLVSSAIKTAEETSGIKIDNKTKAQLNQTILEGLGLDNERKSNENWTPSSIRRAKEKGGIGGYGERAVDWLGNRIGSILPLKF